jgi:putative membrane protein
MSSDHSAQLLQPPPPAHAANPTYLLILLSIYAIEWCALAIAPLDRHDWLLENMLPVLALPLLIAIQRRCRVSGFAWTLVFLFMALHAIGAHYTYAKVPYDDWFRGLTGHSLDALLGFQRNTFDRLVHFLYGLLLFPIVWELLAPAVDPRRPVVRAVLVAGFLMSHAGIYEVIEWIAAELAGGDLGTAYLGTQGDEWDAQKDMALACCGTLLAVAIVHLRDRRGIPARR